MSCKGVSLLILVLTSSTSIASNESPYAGENLRSIKSLSPEEVETLKSGKGMGFAKLAELNHYPGPKHVLESADDLALTPSQLADTEALFEEMRLSAVTLGEKLLAAEMALDRDFGRAAVSPESLERALFEIGRIRAGLRYVHLEAHLRQQRLLTAEQISKYDEIRGYKGAAHDHSRHRMLSDPLEAEWEGEQVCEKLHESPGQRILRCTFPPGVGHERHFHAPHFGYAINGGRMRMTDEGGVREVDLPAGSSFSSDGVPWHEVLNIGDSTVIYLIVERIQ